MSDVLAELRGVSRTYQKGKEKVEVLHNLDLQIPTGDFIAVMGPSGCGKSTTLRCIAGHNDITSGDVFLRDERVNDLPPGQRDTSMMFQNFALFPHKTVLICCGVAE